MSMHTHEARQQRQSFELQCGMMWYCPSAIKQKEGSMIGVCLFGGGGGGREGGQGGYKLQLQRLPG